MVNGCMLGLHSDFHNGAWGYVYSLTLWGSRELSCGETLLVRDGVPSCKKYHVKGSAIYELFHARFNQLFIFGDSIVHGTPSIQGGMDPLRGRLALVGHLCATSPLITGPLDHTVAKSIVADAFTRLREKTGQYKVIQGTLSLRLVIASSGTVESMIAHADSVVKAISGYEQVPHVVAINSLIQDTMRHLRFPIASGATTIELAILVPVPDLRQIEVKSEDKRHSREDADSKEARRQIIQVYGPRADWDGDRFRIDEPSQGTIEIGSHSIVALFDAPMWVPSQRQGFEMLLADSLKALHDVGVSS
jgi:hypothetical protein